MNPIINTLTQSIAAHDARIKELFEAKITCPYKKDKNKFQRCIDRHEAARMQLQDQLDHMMAQEAA